MQTTGISGLICCWRECVLCVFV